MSLPRRSRSLPVAHSPLSPCRSLALSPCRSKGVFSVAAKTRVSVLPITHMGTGKLMPPAKSDRHPGDTRQPEQISPPKSQSSLTIAGRVKGRKEMSIAIPLWHRFFSKGKSG
ncbi:hypothetical protein Syun_025211 [Stephania yunnanensis]|uniref:Uncharacterized protein n=1 Tax=Stephania yunnanensis TaxID=152371 RepID=A0AAP0ER93_9MAGN